MNPNPGGLLYTILIYAFWVPSVLFPLLYGFFRPWRSTEVGKHLMAYSAVVGMAATLIASRTVFGDFPGRAWIVLAILLGLIFVTWWRLSLFFRKGGDG
jgi:hypothetical protein